MEIITNYHRKPFLNLQDLPEKLREEQARDEDEENSSQFAIRNGICYNMSSFMRFSSPQKYGAILWHGYIGETYFSSIVIHICDDGESYIIGLVMQ